MRPDDSRTVALARYGQSMALLNLKREDEAEELLRESIDEAPAAPETLPALLGLARLYEQKGRDQEAIDLYGRVVSRSRDEIGAEALYRLATLLARTGNQQAALEELGRMPSLFVNYRNWVAQALLAQARLYREMGQRQDAERVYQRVVDEYGETVYAETAAQEKAARR